VWHKTGLLIELKNRRLIEHTMSKESVIDRQFIRTIFSHKIDENAYAVYSTNNVVVRNDVVRVVHAGVSACTYVHVGI